MTGLPGGRALAFLYFLPVGVVAVALALVGSVLDLVVPATASRAYQRAAIGVIAALCRPVDAIHAAASSGADTTD